MSKTKKNNLNTIFSYPKLFEMITSESLNNVLVAQQKIHEEKNFLIDYLPKFLAVTFICNLESLLEQHPKENIIFTTTSNKNNKTIDIYVKEALKISPFYQTITELKTNKIANSYIEMSIFKSVFESPIGKNKKFNRYSVDRTNLLEFAKKMLDKDTYIIYELGFITRNSKIINTEKNAKPVKI